MKFFIKLIFLSLVSLPVFAQLGGLPGSFSRLGFNARGISMGNAMTSVIWGDNVGYYNPAVSSFQNEHLINLSYSFLSFDRSLNFVSYTKNFKLPNQKTGGAGITFSLINAGVSNIDGRDYDGVHTENYSTFENQIMFAPSIQVSEQVSLGVGFKFYYSKLFKDVTATSLGFDGGIIYKVNDRWTVGATIKDINSKYEWNTTDLYGSEFGNITKDKFPVLYNIGVSYLLPKEFGVVSLEFQGSSNTRKVGGQEFKSSSYVLKAGAEVSPVQNVKFRAGFDRFDFKAEDKFGNSRVMFGLGYQRNMKNFIVGIDYSFVMEPYSHRPFQTLTAVFKIK